MRYGARVKTAAKSCFAAVLTLAPYGYEEIATRTGKPRTTVAYRLARAVTRLEGQVPDLNTVW